MGPGLGVETKQIGARPGPGLGKWVQDRDRDQDRAQDRDQDGDQDQGQARAQDRPGRQSPI